MRAQRAQDSACQARPFRREYGQSGRGESGRGEVGGPDQETVLAILGHNYQASAVWVDQESV